MPANKDDWDETIPVTPWAYKTTVKRLHKKTPFQWVYGREVLVLAEFILPSMFISEATRMMNNIAFRIDWVSYWNLTKPAS